MIGVPPRDAFSVAGKVVLVTGAATGIGRATSELLASLGVHWLYVILIPVFLFSWAAKKEPQWLPDEAKRKVWARSLIAGSIVLAIVINQIKH